MTVLKGQDSQKKACNFSFGKGTELSQIWKFDEVGCRRPYRWWKSHVCSAENNAWGMRMPCFDVRIALALRDEEKQLSQDVIEEKEVCGTYAKNRARWERRVACVAKKLERMRIQSLVGSSTSGAAKCFVV